MVTLSCGIGLLSGVSHEQETRSPSKITTLGLRILLHKQAKERRKKTEQGPQFSTWPGARISLRLAHPNFTNQTFACGRREELVCFLASEFPRFSSFPLRLQKFACCLLCAALLPAGLLSCGHTAPYLIDLYLHHTPNHHHKQLFFAHPPY